MTGHPLAAVARRRDRVVAAVTGTVGPSGFDAARAAEAALRCLPAGVDYSAVYRSLLPLAGPAQPTPVAVRDCAWALAGDLKSLKAGRPVYPPTLPGTPSPVVLIFLAARRVPRRFRAAEDEARTRYRVRVAQGRAASLVFELTWSDRFVRYRASHPTGLGFGRPPRGNRQPAGRLYAHPDTLVGMLVRVTLEADPKDGKPKVSDVVCSPGQRAFNRALTELRWRAGGFRCPFGFTHHCQDCPKGQASCQAACRPLDLVPGECPTCKQPDTLLDPAWPNAPCGRCTTGRRPLPVRDPTHDKPPAG